MAVIEVQNLGKKYIIDHKQNHSKYSLRELITARILGQKINSGSREEFWALRNVDFSLQNGDKLGIIGPNGSGKSTLLKLISRITEPSEGKVKIKGRVASLLELGTGFHPELTGRENIFLNGVVMGMKQSEIKQYFDEIVDFAGVEKFLDTPIKRFSSGMQVRLGFSVAAHLYSDILIVDEVLSVGDADYRIKCFRKMEDLSNDGRTIVFVSHNLENIKNLTTNCLLIEKSKLKYHGPTDNCINIYLKGLKTNNTPRDLSGKK